MRKERNNKKKALIITGIALGALVIAAVAIFAPLAIDNRPLNAEERQIAEEMFGESIDLDQVRIKIGGPLTLIYPGVTIGYVIAFPEDVYSNSEKHQALLIHELTHVWQYERIGPKYAPLALYEEITEANAYSVNYDPEKSFEDYDLEEQGEIMAEYFLRQTPEFEPYVQEVRGTTGRLYTNREFGFSLEIPEEPYTLPSGTDRYFLYIGNEENPDSPFPEMSVGIEEGTLEDHEISPADWTVTEQAVEINGHSGKLYNYYYESSPEDGPGCPLYVIDGGKGHLFTFQLHECLDSPIFEEVVESFKSI